MTQCPQESPHQNLLHQYHHYGYPAYEQWLDKGRGFKGINQLSASLVTKRYSTKSSALVDYYALDLLIRARRPLT